MATQQKIARFVLENKTSEPLVDVTVVHRCAKDDNEEWEWATLPSDALIPAIDVPYSTAPENDQDFWLITWCSQDRSCLWYLNPRKIQGTVDTLESRVPELIQEATLAIDRSNIDGTEVDRKQTTADLASGIQNAITGLIRNVSVTGWHNESNDPVTGIIVTNNEENKLITFTTQSNVFRIVADCRLLAPEQAAVATTTLTPTKSTASVVVQNKTHEPMVNVTVVHKYSSLYKNKTPKQGWAVIAPGDMSPPFEVNYHTGVGTTGLDWWLLTWYSQENTFFCSDPNNFRNFVNMLERLAPYVLGWATDCLADTVIDDKDPEAKNQIVSDLADRIGKVISDVAIGTEATEGFKEHTLTQEDEGQMTRITVNDNNTITFASRSGISETVYNSKLGLPVRYGSVAQAEAAPAVASQGAYQGTTVGAGGSALSEIVRTRRTANIQVVNDTDKPLASVILGHWYSDQYSENGEWSMIQPGKISPDLQVSFNTGMASGVDWWLVTWFSEDMTTLFSSDPSIFRPVVDLLEKVAVNGFRQVTGEAYDTVVPHVPYVTKAAKWALTKLAGVVLGQLLPELDTENLKIHTLRANDAGRTTRIIIRRDNRIEFISPSGTSVAEYSSRFVMTSGN